MLRLPDFVSKKDFDWAIGEATKKKKLDFSKVEFLGYDEGLCVQCMHLGSYDTEPATVKWMEEVATEKGYEIDITTKRLHHEIYLSDPRKADSSKLKTVVRHPITAFEQKNDTQAPSKYSSGQGAKSQQSLVDCKISQRRPTLYFPVMGSHSFVKML